MPFSHSAFWFISCYVALMVLSPVLNAAVGSLSRRQLSLCVGLLLGGTWWFAYAWNAWAFGHSDGYSTWQFVLMYMVGAWCRRCLDADTVRRYRRGWLLLYVGCAGLWGVCSVAAAYRPWAWEHVLRWQSFAYNNPLLVAASVGFFLFMMSFRFRSRVVNGLAQSALAVYLLQDGVFNYHWLDSWVPAGEPVLKLCLLAVLSVGFMVLALGVDRLRLWGMRPLWRGGDRLWARWRGNKRAPAA